MGINDLISCIEESVNSEMFITITTKSNEFYNVNKFVPRNIYENNGDLEIESEFTTYIIKGIYDLETTFEEYPEDNSFEFMVSNGEIIFGILFS